MTKATKSFLVLSMMIVYTLAMANLSNGEVLLQTGFEEDQIGEIPQKPTDTWEVSGAGFEVGDSNVKAGKQSLAIPGGGGDQALGALIDTQSQVVTAEFWLYVEGVERSLTFFMLGADSGLTDWGAAGPYVNWIGENIRHYSDAWYEIGPMASDKWHYIRVVADTSASVFHIYAADTMVGVHADEPLGKDLAFRSDIVGPPAKICFGTYALVSPVYVDELLIYEGDVFPENILAATKPEGKLALTWGRAKEKQSIISDR